MNNQGKTPKQTKNSENFISLSIMGILILVLVMLLTSCDVTYHLSDSEYSDAREEHLAITYYQGFDECNYESPIIYWGWKDGFYYYYGHKHKYPWYYYYNTCPPSHYNRDLHVIWFEKNYNSNKHTVIVKPISTNTIRPNNNKVIIKRNNGSKRTNKTTIRRKPKK